MIDKPTFTLVELAIELAWQTGDHPTETRKNARKWIIENATYLQREEQEAIKDKIDAGVIVANW